MVYNCAMNLRSVLVASCLALALGACDKKKSDAPAAPTPGTASGAPATPPATPTPPPSNPGSAAGSGAAVAPAAAGEVRIANVAPKVGDKYTETENRTMVAKIEPKPGQVLEVTTTEQRVEEKEVIAVDAGMITKLKVSYPTVKITESALGKTKDKPTPTAGKAYLVWREASGLKATLADGGAVTPEEMKVLAKGQKSVGRPDVMQQIIADRVWKLGETVAMSPAEIARLAEVVGGEDDAGKLTAMGFTLQATDDQTATFAMTMAMDSTAPKGTMKVTLTGTAKVDRNSGRALEVSAGGPFEGNMGMPITGTMKATTSYAY